MLLEGDVWSAVCGACGWVRLYPRKEPHPEGELQTEFEQHMCADYPLPQRKPA